MSDFDQIPDNGTPSTDLLSGAFYATAERVRKALKQDLAEAHLSRDEVAIRLSVRMGRIGAAILDAYVAESKPHKFPAELIPAWIEVTKSRRILDVLCAEVGLSIATEEDRDFAELGRSQMRAKKLRRKLEARV